MNRRTLFVRSILERFINAAADFAIDALIMFCDGSCFDDDDHRNVDWRSYAAGICTMSALCSQLCALCMFVCLFVFKSSARRLLLGDFQQDALPY